MRGLMWTVLVVWSFGLLTSAASAAEIPSFDLSISGQQFQPSELQIPAGRKVVLKVRNLDTIPAEFESFDFNREKVVPGHGHVTIYVGPLDAGTYSFFNDFQPSAKGRLIVK